MRTPTPTAASPLYNIIEPDNERCNHPMPWSSTLSHHFTHIINTHLPGNISIQAMHHTMTLEAIKAATDLQWTGPIIDIKEHCFGAVHPITKQTITQYKELQHDPDLNHPWVPVMSKEVHWLAQGKPGITNGTNTIFFLSPKEVCYIPTDRKVTFYDWIVINHCPQKEDPNHVCITVGGNLINYSFEHTPRAPLTWSPLNFFGTAQSVQRVHVLLEPTSRTCT
jgi:hypothetical protein